MKIIFYDKETKSIESIQTEIKKPVLTATGIAFDGGSFNGINHPFVITDDAADIPEQITDEWINLNAMNPLESDHKIRLESVELAIIDLMDVI
jgi:hypothetical protein